MKKLLVLVLLLAVAGLALSDAYGAADPVVTVEAWGNDRDDALLQARREAIAQGIGTMLTSETEVNNFVLKKDVVLTKITGGVKKVTVLDERKEKDGTYYVRIRATLAEDSIKKDLMALHLLNYEMNYPRLLVLLRNDQNNQGTVVLTDYLISRGFQVVDPDTVSGRLGIDDARLDALYTGSASAIAEVGEKAGADYVLLGNLETQYINNDFLDKSGLRSCRSAISARIVDTRSGTVLASKTADASAAHLSSESARVMSTRKAAKRLLDEALFDQLISSFQDVVNNGFMIQVHVSNVDNYSLEKEIRRFMKSQEVVSVHSKGFAGNAVDLTVHVKGNTIDFCDRIDGARIKGRTVAVSECRGDRVALELQ